MKQERDSLSEAIRRALGLTFSVTTAFGGSVAFAQDDVEDEILVTEEVLVTGSLVKRANLDNANPVTVVTREDMMVTGMTDVGDLIQRLPSMSGSPLSTTVNNGGNGSTQVDLRGIGSGRTLNLINGRRSVDGGDYQTIPTVMVERIEILKDGGAAAYGADAVAGVVNVITRKDFDGVEVELLHADWMDTDSGAQSGVSAVFGKSFDGGHFVAGIEYIDQEEAYQSDAPWDFFQDSYFIYPGGCEAQTTAAWDGSTSGGCYPLGSSRIPEGRLRTVTQGTVMNPDGSGLVPYDGRSYNYAPVNYIQTPYKKTNLFLDGRMEVTDTIEFSAMLRSSFRDSAQELAPQPYNSPTDPAYNGVWAGPDGDVAYSGISPDNYYLQQAFAAAGLTPEPIVDARRRMLETKRRFEQNVEQTQVNFQLDGSALFGTDISWTAYYNYGRRTREDKDFGQFFGPNLSNAMGPSADLNGDGSPECYEDVNDPSSVVSGCVPFNFFGGPGSVTQEMLDYVGVDLVDTYRDELDQYGLSFTGSLFNLPGGSIGWAAGYESREEALTYSPDSAKQKDEVTGNTGLGTFGDFDVDSYFVEAVLPVLDNVELSVGWRYEDFSTYGSEDVWKVGARWDITDDLAIRGTWGEVFRSPDIYDLFQGLVDSFPTYLDPCSDRAVSANGSVAPGCTAQSEQLDTQVLAREGGNPNLEAETGETLTLGVVWTPTLGNVSLEMTADYWEIELEQGITSLGVNYILDDCYTNQNAASCSLVTRRADYSIAQILDAPINASELYVEGIDLGIDATWELPGSQLSASILWSHFLDNWRKSFPGDDEFDLVGRFSGGGQYSYAEDKANLNISWAWDSLRISYLGEYISSLNAPVQFLGDYTQKVDSQMYHDIVVDFTFNRTGTTISAGVTNLTDEEPPYIDYGFNASTDPSTYRMFGQGYYFRIRQAF